MERNSLLKGIGNVAAKTRVTPEIPSTSKRQKIPTRPQKQRIGKRNSPFKSRRSLWSIGGGLKKVRPRAASPS